VLGPAVKTTPLESGSEAQRVVGLLTRSAVNVAPVAGSQMIAVWSSLVVTSQLPSGAVAQERTSRMWRVRVGRGEAGGGGGEGGGGGGGGGEDTAAVGGDRRWADEGCVAGQGVTGRAGGWVPNDCGLVPAGGDQPAAVRGDGTRAHLTCVAGQGVAGLAGGWV